MVILNNLALCCTFAKLQTYESHSQKVPYNSVRGISKIQVVIGRFIYVALSDPVFNNQTKHNLESLDFDNLDESASKNINKRLAIPKKYIVEIYTSICV